MKSRLFALSVLVPCAALAQPAKPSELESLREEMRLLRSRTEQLEQKLKQFEGLPPSTASGTNTIVGAPTTGPSSDDSTPARRPGFSPANGIALLRTERGYLDLGFSALLNVGSSTAQDPSQFLNLGDHDPSQRGFSMRNAEISLTGAVDPYFKGAANVVFKLDNDNETEIELEEVFLQTTSLPGNFDIKGGYFFANFGRHNPQHPHQWAFVDQPLILNRTFGPEGLRNLGAQLGWLLPTPFFAEMTLGIFNGSGGTAFSFRNPGEDDGAGVERVHGRATAGEGLRNPSDLLFVPRAAVSFDLTDSQTLLFGTSAALGQNDTGQEQQTQIYGADLMWKWKSANAQAGFPFVAWQTEGLYQRFEAGEDSLALLPAETLEDYGFYSQLLWGFKPRWVAGLRGEYATGNTGAFDAGDIFRNDRTRVSPNLTWYPTEFSKLRLQYNFDRGDLFGEEHSVWFQIEFQLGAHGAHKF